MPSALAFRMNKREKYAVCLACMLVVVAVVFQFGISPVLEKKRVLKRQLASKKKTLGEVARLKAEYDTILNKSKKLKNIYSQRPKGFNLFAFLESLARKAGVDQNIDYMKPSSKVDKGTNTEFSIVEMKLKKIKLSQLMSYLYLVETSKNVVFVKRFAISRDGKNERTISAVLHMETVKS